MPALLIAIDGPAGAGKSAAARGLARRLGVPYVDTGATYRAIALAVLRAGVALPLDEPGCARAAAIAAAARIELAGDGVRLDGEDVTAALRTPEVSQASSQVSAVPAVRRELVRLQRHLAAGGGVVEGRDIGTVVFPDAELKVFMTASPEVRAKRRFDELRHRGADLAYADVLEEQRARDLRDSSRADSPLVPAPDAVILDTSSLTLEQVIERLVELVREARGRSSK